MNVVPITGVISTALLWRSKWSYSLKKLIVRKMPKVLNANLIAICDFYLETDLSENLQECVQWICHICLSASLSACSISKTSQRTS